MMAERVSMMDQYRAIKARHRDAVLFFRLGDFYEMFFDDALEVSRLLDLTLTKRQGEPMCGIPYHAAKPYIARLLRAGKKIAVCEQLGEPGPGKGIVERGVVEVVTPGTAIDEDFLDRASNNYLVALCATDKKICLAWLELSSGEFCAYSRPDLETEGAALLRDELQRLSPREIIVQQSLLDRAPFAALIAEAENLVVNAYPDWSFDKRVAYSDITARFCLASLKGFGFDEGAPELAAAGVLLRYLDETAKSGVPQLSPPTLYDEGEFVSIDESSRKNLELVKNLSDAGRNFTLLSVMDSTRTAPGARLLRRWIVQPLRSRAAIEQRLDAVEFLYRDQRLLARLREILGSARDAERLAARVAMDKAHAKELLALRDTIRAIVSARALVRSGKTPPPLAAGNAALDAEPVAIDAAARIDAAIKEEPSILLSEGNLIREGFDAQLDRLRVMRSDSDRVLESYIDEERRATGINGLRVRYNRIIGYYIEVSKGRLDSVPGHFIRRQSLVSGERFTTTRLAELESEINGATERIIELERKLFLELRETVKAAVPDILALGRDAAILDCLASNAWTATSRGYSRPRLSEEPCLRIDEGRHPIVEAHLPPAAFVPNGIALDAAAGAPEPAFILLTGPNMAGKSTFLRQTALIALMAQTGSFVPALDAEIGLVDKIFCRVGAQDNLARGESTFLVEMNETAYIMNAAGPRSLVIMDEVGRGTGTLDGLAIAWAVSESLLSDLRCRTLFATHYHELTGLEHPKLKNFSMAVLENKGDIVFLKKVEPGPAAGSYGLHVAMLAGLPSRVLERASALRAELDGREQGLELTQGSSPAKSRQPASATEAAKPSKARVEHASCGLFSAGELVLAEIAGLDIDKLSPLEALNRLASFKSDIQSG